MKKRPRLTPSPLSRSIAPARRSARRDPRPINRQPRGNGLVGRLPPDTSIGVSTAFATIEIVSKSGRFVTPPRWIDNEPALERATREREVDPDLREFARRDFGNASQQRILEAIYSVSADLLNAEDPEWSKKPTETTGSTPSGKGAGDDDEPASRPVDPAKVLFGLKELAAETWTKNPGQTGVYGVSLQGAIGMLFRIDEEPEIDLTPEKWQGEKPDDDFGDD